MFPVAVAWSSCDNNAVLLCTSSLVDDVMFSHEGRNTRIGLEYIHLYMTRQVAPLNCARGEVAVADCTTHAKCIVVARVCFC